MIVVVSQRVPFPPNKGDKLRTYHHIKHLVEAGHAVQVLSLRHERSDDELAFQLARELNIKVTLFSMAPKLLRYAVSFLKGQAISVGAFYSRALKQRIHELMQTTKPLSFYLTASSLAPYVLSKNLAEQPNIKLLMDFIDVDSDKWQQYAKESKSFMKWLYQREANTIKQLEKQVNTQFDQCFLITDAEIALLEQTVGVEKPITALPNGIDQQSFHPGDIKNRLADPTFLFTGVMDYKPNADAVLWFYQHCWPSIKQHFPQAKFVIAGMNPSASVAALNKHEDVDVTGFVDDILPYYHAAWVFVAPFRIARGVQNKILQASACRLPVVTTPMGAEGISFANEQTMYIETGPEEFATACIRAIEHQSEAIEKAQSALEKLTENYGWHAQLQPLTRIFAQ